MKHLPQRWLAPLAFWLTDESVTRVLLTTTLLFWLMAIGAVLTFPRTFGFAVTLVSGFLVLLPSWLLLVRLHASAPHGTGLCMTLLAVVWASDVGAYAFGRWLGRTKLAPAVSPGKTWEGAWTGLIGVGLLAVAWVLAERSIGGEASSLYDRLWLGLGGLGAVLAFVGTKMVLAHTEWKIPTMISLGVIVGILAVSVVASLLRPRRGAGATPAPTAAPASAPAS